MNKTCRLTMTAMAALLTLGSSAFAANVTLKWALWDWDKTPYYQPLIAAYEAKHPDVTIKYVDLGSTDYQTMLSTQLTGGADDLDVVTVKDTPGYTTLVRANQLAPLNDYMAANGIKAEDYQGIVEQMTVDGKVYALPFRDDFWVTYYNKDLFDKAGVPYPTNDMTLAQFDDLAAKLTSGFGANKTYGALFHIWRSTVQLYGILDGKHTIIDGKYEFLKPYYERVLKLQKEGAVPSYAQLKTSNTHYSGPFFNSTIAMLPMGTWFIGTQIAKVKTGESLAKNWGIVKYPHPADVPAGTTLATLTSLAVNAKSSHEEDALDFVKFVTGPEGAQIIAKTGNLPAINDPTAISTVAAQDGFPTDENSKEALQTTKAYLEMPVTTKSAEIEVILNRVHDAIMTDNESVDDGIAEMDRQVQEILEH